MKVFNPRSKRSATQIARKSKRRQPRSESSLETSAFQAAPWIASYPHAAAQRQLQAMANKSPRVQSLARLESMISNGPRVRSQGEHYDHIKRSPRQVAQKSLPGTVTPSDASRLLHGHGGVPENRTGLPNGLKSGLEQLSGMDISGVRVHRNSAKPARIQASAYTQGQDIYLGPGQEQCLPHEGWHAVQQLQGRVQPTAQSRGALINDNEGLEREADVMGSRALQMRRPESTMAIYARSHQSSLQRSGDIESRIASQSVVQRVLAKNTMVKVFEDSGKVYYGTISAVHDTTYEVKVGEDRIAKVPKHQVALHDALVASGTVPAEAENLKRDVSKAPYSYHVTAYANLASILKAKGLHPSAKLEEAAFAGLDAARGANKEEYTPDRLKTLYSAARELSENESLLPGIQKLIYDAMLGTKGDFVYATRYAARIFNYAADIRTKGKQGKLVVLRFKPQGKAWYIDQEDDTADKTLSSIGLDKIEVADFSAQTKADVETSVARETMDSLTWYKADNEEQMSKLRSKIIGSST